MKLLERKEYMDRLIAYRDKKLIKVITGIRRCGKSTLMEMFRDYLMADGVASENILYLNLEDFEMEPLQEVHALYSYIKGHLDEQRMNYIFIDEVQQCPDFPKAVDSLFLKSNTDIYLTGSNANLLSSEIATLLSGRYVEIHMLPLSFAEYIADAGESNLQRQYTKYIEESSFPYTLELSGRPREIREYLEGIYSTIVVKDIASRKKISDIMMLQSVIRFMFDNIGNTFSTKKIADVMTSSGRKIDVKTVEKYLDGLTESMILYRAGRYDIKGKQNLRTMEKYYVADIGLRSMLLGASATDVGHVLENVIYLELRRRSYEVYVGKINELEVDFVIKDEKKRVTYIQVAATVRDENTLARELTPLKKIQDHYPKLILTLDEDPEAVYDGIRRINALDWLLGKV